jgi:hypothetical protein
MCNTELQPPQATRANQSEEQETIDNEIKCTSMTLPLVEAPLNKVSDLPTFTSSKI